jgi:hypothetical protein
MIDPLMAFAALKTASSTISSAVKADAHFRKEEANRIRDEMRELFMLFGSPGQWERLQAEIAAERVRRKKALEAEARRKRRLKNMIILTLSLVTAITILTLEIMYLKGAL